MATPKNPASQVLHGPTRTSREVVTWVQDVTRSDAPELPIPGVRSMLLPLFPGRLMTILSRPGHGKTSLLGFCARGMAAGMDPLKDALVFVSLEQYVEEIACTLASHVGVTLQEVYKQQASGKKLDETARYLMRSPVWFIGHSIKEHGRAVVRTPDGDNIVIPDLTDRVLFSCVETMQQEYGVRPRALFLDYLQLLHVDGPGTQEENIQRIPPVLKRMALKMELPVVAAAQASRDVDKRPYKLPTMSDAQWASTIEQASDTMLALWRLAMTEKVGDEVAVHGTKVRVTEDMLLAGLIKQRGGPAPGKWLLRFLPADLSYSEYVLKEPDF